MAGPGGRRPPRSNGAYLRNQILPWFRGHPIDDITRGEMQRWFAAQNATRAAANRSLPILSVILRQAEVYGHRPEDSNPCVGLAQTLSGLQTSHPSWWRIRWMTWCRIAVSLGQAPRKITSGTSDQSLISTTD